MTRTISKSEYYALLGLKHVADKLTRQQGDLEAAAREITGDEKNSHTCDLIYGGPDGRSVDETLGILGIKVSE